MPEVSLDDQIRCVQREIRLRERVYPRLVVQEQMSRLVAENELAAMRAVLETLEAIRQPSLPWSQPGASFGGAA